MASIGHLAVGALAGTLYARSTGARPIPAALGFATLSLAPDVDLLWIESVAAESPWSHRAATHSLLVAMIAGTVLGLALGRRRVVGPWVLLVLTLASHGMLDAMTALGDGPELLWPFDQSRITLSWTPIPGADSYRRYLEWGGLPILVRETVMFLPVLAMAWLLSGIGVPRNTGRDRGPGEPAEEAG